MFACMVDVARAIHLGKLTLRQGIRELHSKFLRFKESKDNLLKQRKLVEYLVRYIRQCHSKKFQWEDGARRIQWSITNDVMLTGLTPWVVKDEDGYISYFVAESEFEWKSQLRFPLYQQYLSENTIDCSTNEVRIGFYFCDTNKFDVKSFNKRELKLAVDETGDLFTTLFTEFKRRRK